MLRDYALQQQILSQYITVDPSKPKSTTILANPSKKSKYTRILPTNDQKVQQRYNLTKRQLDTLIQQYAKTYNYQWKVVSTALYKQHNILISDRALNFRYYKLHPRNKKQGYTIQQSYQLLKSFYIYGKRYKDINQKFGYRGQHSIRNILYQLTLKGFMKLQNYLSQEISFLPIDLIIDKKKSRKTFLIQTLILNYGVKWEYNQYSFSLFYIFIIGTEQDIKKIPKELAMLLYRRFIELIDQKKQQKKQMYDKIQPNLYKELELAKQERNRRCANKFRERKMNEWSTSGSGSGGLNGGVERGENDEQGRNANDLDNIDLEELKFNVQESQDESCEIDYEDLNQWDEDMKEGEMCKMQEVQPHK